MHDLYRNRYNTTSIADLSRRCANIQVSRGERKLTIANTPGTTDGVPPGGAEGLLEVEFLGIERRDQGKLVLRLRRMNQDAPSPFALVLDSPADNQGRQVISRSFPLEHDPLQECFFLAGALVKLTRQEYRLLRFLAKHPRQLLSHERLLEGAWEDPAEGERSALYSCVYRLRQRLGPARDLIASERRGGYRFMPDRG